MVSRLEPLLLLWWFWNIFRKEFIGGVVVADIPEILCHGDDEGANDQDSKKCGVFAYQCVN